MFDIVILTDHRYVNPTTTNWYIDQVLLEDKLLQSALEEKGLSVCKKSWDDENFNWELTKYAIFRTTWDYFERFDEFSAWIEHTKERTTFINSANIINWNIDKHYLRDLSQHGIEITPTLFVEKGENVKLEELFQKSKWNEAIIKPAISGAARHTYRLKKNKYSNYENILNELKENECMLFQEFMSSITTNGEISIVIIRGKYTHAVKKIAKKGDFRVQDDHGGKVIQYTPTAEEIKFAEKCIAKCPFSPLYARVDIVYNNNNKPTLIELELIEPELWFRKNPKSAIYLANGIFSLISSKKHPEHLK